MDYNTKSISNHYFAKMITIFIIKRVYCETITIMDCA